VHYSDADHAVAIMSINTLLKDCSDESPLSRGLALRSLASMRMANVAEYLSAPLAAGLRDTSPYVRKTAVMGALKLFYLSPAALEAGGIRDRLYEMLRDRDPLVVTNVIAVLDEVEPAPGCRVTRPVVHHLLNRIREFSEWSQCVVLGLVSRYDPEGEEDEIFDVMNLLEPLLKHSNSAVVLATTKIFLHLTESMPDVHVQVYERIKTPLLTMMSAGVEIGFAVLHHIELLVQRVPHVFEHDYKSFFCRYSDPSYVKALKLDVLTAIASDASALAIVEELGEYVTDVNADIARRSIRATAQIAIGHPDAAEAVIAEMLKLAELSIDYVTAETMICLADVLRKYPEHCEDAMALLPATLPNVDDADARAAMVSMLGEFGEHLECAPWVVHKHDFFFMIFFF
jgi:vesicle coat complex subunit